MYHDSQDTIVALSTPSGSSLRAIIRISGPDALHCAKELFIPPKAEEMRHSHAGANLCVRPLGQTHRSAPTVALTPKLFRNDTKSPVYQSFKGSVRLSHEHIEIPATLYIMNAPYSYTREDVAEIHTFGSPPLLNMIIEALIALEPPSKGCIRLAQPGEFTKRAFLHGRLDLAQAEAVMALIRSRNDAELRTAFSHLKGSISKMAKEIQSDLIACRAEVEAAIDFSDQDIEFIPRKGITEKINSVHRKLTDVLNKSGDTTRVHLDGVKTVLCGHPNAGKSSLFNALLGKQHAIVTHIPGTTRDVLEGVLELGNIRFQLNDTAGFMKTEKEIESLAIEKTHSSLQTGQLILFVLDGTKEIGQEDIELYNSYPSMQKIIVINKCDITTNTPLYPPLIEGTKAGVTSLPSKSRRPALGGRGPGGVLPPPDDFQRYPVVRTSAITGDGLEALKDVMVRTILEGRIDQSSSDLTLNTRHKAAFKRTLELVKSAMEATEQSKSYEFIALDLRDALETLAEVAGETTADDILEKIFSNFCIGK